MIAFSVLDIARSLLLATRMTIVLSLVALGGGALLGGVLLVLRLAGVAVLCGVAVGRGQWEASASLAMSWPQQMRHVIIPHALRIAIPATVGFSVQVVKGTALTSIVGFIELTRTAAFISNATYRPLLTYATVAVIYFLLCWPLSLGAALLGRKLNVTHRAQ